MHGFNCIRVECSVESTAWISASHTDRHANKVFASIQMYIIVVYCVIEGNSLRVTSVNDHSRTAQRKIEIHSLVLSVCVLYVYEQ